MESTTKTVEFRIESDPETRDNIYNLARNIANLPQNHDELEVVIADEIKRFVHAEKLSVYHRILMYADAEKFPKEKHLQWLAKSCLQPKVETHQELASKWKYGTEFSCRPHMIQEDQNDSTPNT